MLAAVSDYPVDASSLQVDWLRVTPYSTSCTFLSRVFDAGMSVNWNALAWTGETPAGTTLAMSYRVGNTAAPDGSWTAFVPVTGSGGALTGNSRYVQYQAQLATTDATQTPVLDDVTIFYSSGPDTTPPAISAVTATPGAGGTATITWTTDEPANSQVDYGTDSGSLTLTASSASLVTTHSITLTGLSPSTTYYFRVTSADASGNSATSPASQVQPASFVSGDTTPPVISAVTATAGAGGIATVTWTTDEPANSRVDYGTDSNSLTLTASSASLVTTHGITLTGLSPSTTYHFRVTSADAFANSATSPASSAPPASFNTPAPPAIFVDTTVTDFGAGSPDPNTYIAQTTDGEVILNPTVGAEFYGSTLPAGWLTITNWTGSGSVAVSGGNLTVNGALVGTATLYGPGRSLEFVATFQPKPLQHAGFGNDLNNTPWAIFGTGTAGTGLQARTYDGTTFTDHTITGNWLGSSHRYRIDWTATNVVFSIDGQVADTQNVAHHGQLAPGGQRLHGGWSSRSPLTGCEWVRTRYQARSCRGVRRQQHCELECSLLGQSDASRDDADPGLPDWEYTDTGRFMDCV